MDAGEYRERLRLELADLGVATWEDDTLDQALRQALEDYNDVNPDQAIATHTFASASREAALSASTFARLIRVLRVWLPYTASDPEHPPKWRAGFELWPGNILYIADDPEPAASDVASARASALRETVSAEDDSYKQTAGFAFRRLNEFRAGLNRIRARAAGGYVALPVQRRGRVPRQ